VVWMVEGVLTSREIMAFNEEAAEHPQFDQCKYFIWDTTLVTEYVKDIDDSEFAATYSAGLVMYNRCLLGAIIAVHPEVQMHANEYMAAMEVMGIPWELKMFTNLSDGQQWIDSKL